MSGIVGALVADVIHLIASAIWGLDWAGIRTALSGPILQAWIATLLVPSILLGAYAYRHRGKLSFETIAKITLCGMAAGYQLVFIFNVPRPNNPLMKDLIENPLNAMPYFLIPLFYLLHSVLKTIATNRV